MRLAGFPFLTSWGAGLGVLMLMSGWGGCRATFVATTVLAMLHVVRTRGGGGGAQPGHAGWVGETARA